MWLLLRPFAPWIGLAGVALAAWLYIGHLTDRAEKAEARAEQASRQAQINDASRQTVERYVETRTIIQQKAETGREAIRKDPGASDVFEPRDAVCAALRELRGSDACLDDPGPANLP